MVNHFHTRLKSGIDLVGTRPHQRAQEHGSPGPKLNEKRNEGMWQIICLCLPKMKSECPAFQLGDEGLLSGSPLQDGLACGMLRIEHPFLIRIQEAGMARQTP